MPVARPAPPARSVAPAAPAPELEPEPVSNKRARDPDLDLLGTLTKKGRKRHQK
jgi:hypothetical protein